MRVVLQRVKNASVTIAGKVVARILKGYLLLVGFAKADTIESCEYMAKKIAKLRVFPDEDDKMNLSIKEIQGEILSVSQFTLYGDLKDGNRPSFTNCLDPVLAEDLYRRFNNLLAVQTGLPVRSGVFGAAMDVALVNDGPVTIILEK